MPLSKKEIRNYLSMLEKIAQDTAPDVGLPAARIKLCRSVLETILAPGAAPDPGPVIERIRAKVADLLLRQPDHPGLNFELGEIDAIDVILSLDPLRALSSKVRSVAADQVAMAVLMAVESEPRHKTDLSDEILWIEPALDRNARRSMVSKKTKELLSLGLIEESWRGRWCFAHLSERGQRLLALVRRGRIGRDSIDDAGSDDDTRADKVQLPHRPYSEARRRPGTCAARGARHG